MVLFQFFKIFYLSSSTTLFPSPPAPQLTLSNSVSLSLCSLFQPPYSFSLSLTSEYFPIYPPASENAEDRNAVSTAAEASSAPGKVVLSPIMSHIQYFCEYLHLPFSWLHHIVDSHRVWGPSQKCYCPTQLTFSPSILICKFDQVLCSCIWPIIKMLNDSRPCRTPSEITCLNQKTTNLPLSRRDYSRMFCRVQVTTR